MITHTLSVKLYLICARVKFQGKCNIEIGALFMTYNF